MPTAEGRGPRCSTDGILVGAGGVLPLVWYLHGHIVPSLDCVGSLSPTRLLPRTDLVDAPRSRGIPTETTYPCP